MLRACVGVGRAVLAFAGHAPRGGVAAAPSAHLKGSKWEGCGLGSVDGVGRLLPCFLCFEYRGFSSAVARRVAIHTHCVVALHAPRPCGYQVLSSDVARRS